MPHNHSRNSPLRSHKCTLSIPDQYLTEMTLDFPTSIWQSSAAFLAASLGVQRYRRRPLSRGGFCLPTSQMCAGAF